MTSKHLYDGDTFEHRGHTFRVTFPQDEDAGTPWDNCDGHGPVSDWTTRDKAPGERVLVSDRHSKRYYDVREATIIARRDGWGCKHVTPLVDGETTEKTWRERSGHATKGEMIACAVDCDFEYLRRWCADLWSYVSVIVTLLDEGGEETDESESLGGVESEPSEYLEETARELADEILSRVEVDEPNVQLSEN